MLAREAPHLRVSVPALLAKNGLGGLEVSGTAAPGDEKKRFSMHSFGAQFAEVRVDSLTAEIRVSRYVGAFAAGRILNAKTARSQAIGGIVFGIGMALLEETHIDRNIGRVTNANIAEYVVPVHGDIPDITTIFVEEQDRAVNPVGVKGLGELPIVDLGFNQDLAGRQVFEGILPVAAGSRRTCVNWHFAQAGRYSRQHEDHSYGGDQFPFSYPIMTDPISGRTG